MFIVIKFAEDLLICNHRDKYEHAQLFFYNNDQAEATKSSSFSPSQQKTNQFLLFYRSHLPLFAICNDNNTVSKAGSVASNKGY